MYLEVLEWVLALCASSDLGDAWTERAHDVLALEDHLQVRVRHQRSRRRKSHSRVRLLARRRPAASAVDIVQLTKRGLGPDAEPTQMTTCISISRFNA